MNHLPHPLLRPWVRKLWVTADLTQGGRCTTEHVVPTGDMHLVLRFGQIPVRQLTHAGDLLGNELPLSVLGGARAGSYLRHAAPARCVLGAMLRPGASLALFGLPATELTNAHTDLRDLAGGDVSHLRECVEEHTEPQAQLRVFEGWLLRRLLAHPGDDTTPRVHLAERMLRAQRSVSGVADAVNWSPRHLSRVFAAHTGLQPKAFSRVVNIAASLPLLATPQELVHVALERGFADQSHFQREFLRVVGLTPGQWRALSPTNHHHVPLASRFTQPVS